jgi:hypothetical protein
MNTITDEELRNAIQETATAIHQIMQHHVFMSFRNKDEPESIDNIDTNDVNLSQWEDLKPFSRENSFNDYIPKTMVPKFRGKTIAQLETFNKNNVSKRHSKGGGGKGLIVGHPQSCERCRSLMLRCTLSKPCHRCKKDKVKYCFQNTGFDDEYYHPNS